MKHRFYALALAALTLTACSGNTVKQTLGLNREGPDEFRVVSRPPLSVPPQFNLRPPAAPGEAPAMLPTDKQAQAQLLGKKGQANGDTFSLAPGAADTAVTPVDSSPLGKSKKSGSAAESQFLKNAGTEHSDAAVREKIEADKIASQPQPEESWWDSIFSSVKPTKKDSIVNANGEAQRIKQDQDEGKPVTEGATPEVKGRDTGMLGRIFGY